MGQRLNLEVVYEDNTLANAYYHWSAYTRPAFILTITALYEFIKMGEAPSLMVALKMLQATGAGINRIEESWIEEEYMNRFIGINFKKAVDRNEGFLSISKKGIFNTRWSEEKRVTIDLSNKIVKFDVIEIYTKEEWENEWPVYLRKNFDELPEFDFNPCSIPFDEMQKLYEAIETYPDGYRTKNGLIFKWI